MKKKRTFFCNVLAIYIRNERWWNDPKNSDKIMLFYQYNFQIGMICFLSILMIGCATLKKKTETTDKIAIQTVETLDATSLRKTSLQNSSNSTANQSSNSDKYLSEIETKTANWTARLTTYDTSLPIDSLTGLPPVASVLDLNDHSTDEKQSRTGEKSNTKADNKLDVKSDYKSETTQKQSGSVATKIKADTKLATSIQTSFNPYWGLYAVVLLAVAFFCFLNRKNIFSQFVVKTLHAASLLIKKIIG